METTPVSPVKAENNDDDDEYDFVKELEKILSSQGIPVPIQTKGE